MNNIIEQRIKQFISIKFLTTQSEITALTMLLNSIEKDFQNIHGKGVINDQQIETRQIYTLNKIQSSFSNGDAFLKFFNYKSDNTNFAKFNTMKLMAIVSFIDDAQSSDIMEALNQSQHKVTKPYHKKNNKKVNNKKSSHKKVDIIYK